MAWSQAPSVRLTRTLQVRDLEPLLRRTVTRQVAADVNVADLERVYGADRRVVLLVLHGVFNSLPPDEGVIVNGDVVELVDPTNDHVLLLTD
jgi:hypothetical protein